MLLVILMHYLTSVEKVLRCLGQWFKSVRTVLYSCSWFLPCRLLPRDAEKHLPLSVAKSFSKIWSYQDFYLKWLTASKTGSLYSLMRNIFCCFICCLAQTSQHDSPMEAMCTDTVVISTDRTGLLSTVSRQKNSL